ncbi:type II toxin-antitoxin system RelE/ParE family toxin [Aminobacter sp. P9b]|uniref:Plasmid stabilization system protein ParE n=1 Tax=Aminobacter niigataensis TaxID=83265 RepID=A0ABR6L058_9HYPH|nr:MULTISPECIES: type II toxin-antitoxin system RelE/ParE family toxin [Aminobacter]AWC24613.1 Toxin RelE4 [Aminobacter sp. MSH1]MBB4650023.1 plasmid stabilization system protein ParE [Aminobacter niigataensis]
MRLRYTLPALADLEGILDHIAAESPSAAKKVAKRIKVITELLQRHPEVGRLTDEDGIRRINTRPYPYLIFYEHGGDEVVIHAVRHGARDPADMQGYGGS